MRAAREPQLPRGDDQIGTRSSPRQLADLDDSIRHVTDVLIRAVGDSAPDDARHDL